MQRRPPGRRNSAAGCRRTALRNFDALLPACKSELEQSDPELAEIVGNFAFDEVLRYGELDERTRRMTLLASAIALQAEGVYRSLLDAALDGGVTRRRGEGDFVSGRALRRFGQDLRFHRHSQRCAAATGRDVAVGGAVDRFVR